jgi:hypothetical protein
MGQQISVEIEDVKPILYYTMPSLLFDRLLISLHSLIHTRFIHFNNREGYCLLECGTV